MNVWGGNTIINDFNTKYHKKLGDLIEEILVLREEYYSYMYKNSQEYEKQHKELVLELENLNFIPEDSLAA